MALKFREPEKITIPITSNAGDFKVICKPIQAPRFFAVMNKHHEYFAKVINAAVESEDEMSLEMKWDLMPSDDYLKDVDSIMQSLVVGWEGVTGEDDKPLEYSFDKLKTLAEYDMGIYTQFVMTATTLVNKMSYDKAKESEKNSTGSAPVAH